MLQAAEQTVKELCGTNIKTQILGNAPFGFMKYVYPKEEQEKQQCVGAKVKVF